jgi:hypothetical protein
METLETFIGSFLFALIFLFGNKLEGPLGFSRRRVLSAAAGVSIAYGFIRMLPELNEAGRTFEEATGPPCSGLSSITASSIWSYGRG